VSAAIAAATDRLWFVAHDAVVARASANVGRLDAKLDAATSNGELQNREFRRRRIEAAARRLAFPTYNAALAKLRGSSI
jgi:hypothetical protein